MNELTTTVVITNYNQGKFFKSAISSILKQTLLPQRIIIVDDKSTDDSVKIIEKELLASRQDIKNKNIQVDFIKRETNGKLPAARNTAIKLINTDLIAFLDVDDFYYPEKIAKSVAKFKLYPHVSVVYSDYDMWDIRTKQESREFKHPYDVRFLTQTCIVSTNSLVRKSLFDKVGLYNEKYAVAEDYELWLRACKHCMFLHIPEALFCYRIHGGNITLNHAAEMERNIAEYKRDLLNAR